MNDNDAPVYIFKTHKEAEAAVRLLMRSGFDPARLSLVGKGYHSEEHPVGFYTAGDRIRSWGGAGAFWGGFWGLLFAPAVFFLPGLGLVAMAGPFVSTLVGVLEGAVLIGGVSALGAALIEIGVPKDQVVKYENALTVDSYVLMVHGTPAEAHKARMLLLESGPAEAA
ncbi:MAG: DUF1269 domain-containing protein [Burkholderiaceae bacterium]